MTVTMTTVNCQFMSCCKVTGIKECDANNENEKLFRQNLFAPVKMCAEAALHAVILVTNCNAHLIKQQFQSRFHSFNSILDRLDQVSGIAMSEGGGYEELGEVILETEEIERPEPVEIGSPSEDGGSNGPDGLNDIEVEQRQDDEDEDLLANSDPIEEQVYGANDDDEDQLEAINPKRLLDSDDDESDKSSPIKTKHLLDSDDEDGEVKKVSPRKRIVIPDDDSDDDDELRKLEARVRDSDDEASKDAGDDDVPRSQTTIEAVNDEDDAEKAAANGDDEVGGKTDVIADIFGESGDEDEDFEGFKKPEEEEDKEKDEGGGDGLSQVAADLEDSSSDDDGERRSSQRSVLI